MKLFARGLCLVALATAHAQKNAPAARELTVRLFSTAPVRNLSIASQTATMRLCDTCKPTSVAGKLVIQTLANSSTKVSIGPSVAREVRVDGELQVTSYDGRSARGAGKWLVKPSPDGLHITLSLPSERYVMAVLQSEAGAADGPESLKALAVVARSFALVNPTRHGTEGLCDSTHCQSARMNPVPQRIRDAVIATAGETLWFGNRRVDGYFTQSCGGHTADAAEVWGGAAKPWLRAHADPYCQREPAQWRASVTREELLHSLLEQGLRGPPVIEALRIVAKDSSGRAAKIEVLGNGQRLVLNASAVRFAVNRQLGWNRLRSDWYTTHREGDTFVFDGRGYGHGVGLCQVGAAEMARGGKHYREILGFYFPGTEVRVDAGDGGWHAEDENGWILRATHPDADVVRAGNLALASARAHWGVMSSVRPSVTIVPNTELFRQMTGQPGWTLAATSGGDVTLQPAAVVKAHATYEQLLLHEFLHVLVEAEANGTCPLWLREGLVETLAGERGGATSMTPDRIESALQQAHSLGEAQRAHHAAAALVGMLVTRYGLGSVRGWLRSGVPAGVFAGQQP